MRRRARESREWRSLADHIASYQSHLFTTDSRQQTANIRETLDKAMELGSLYYVYCDLLSSSMGMLLSD